MERVSVRKAKSVSHISFIKKHAKSFFDMQDVPEPSSSGHLGHLMQREMLSLGAVMRKLCQATIFPNFGPNFGLLRLVWSVCAGETSMPQVSRLCN